MEIQRISMKYKINTYLSSDYHNLVDLFIGEVVFRLFSSLQDYYIRKQIVKTLSLMRTTS